MTTMRILVACTHQNLVGGIETYLHDLLPALRARGHAVGLLTSFAAVPERPRVAGPELPVWSLDRGGWAGVSGEVEAWRPDVVFLHGLDAPADEEALVERYPTALFAHGHNGTCVSGTRTHAFPTHRPCGRRFGPACLALYFPRRCGGLNPVTMTRLYLIQKRRAGLVPRYAAVIVGSRYLADEYRDHGVPAERLHRVPLFPTGQAPDPAPPRRPRTDRVLMVGRLYKEKGAHLLAEAVARAAARLGRALTLVVAGEGPERAAMQARAARLNLPAEFHGWVGPERRAELMRGADLLAVPSVCPETFGLVGVEAGCLGLPAAGFAVCGVPDWLVAGESGELAPGDPPTAAALADALWRALADPDHLRRLSAGAWRTARTFSREAHVAAVEAVLARTAGVPGA